MLEAALEDTVTITLKDGTRYVGELQGYDQHMNAVLDPPASADLTTEQASYVAVEDTMIIRGDNVVSINL